jgi:hypothetical protein
MRSQRYNPLNHATQLLITTEKDSTPYPLPAGEGQPDTPIKLLNQGEVMTPRIEKSIIYIPSHQVSLGGKDVKKR